MIARAPDTSAGILSRIAADPRWTGRYAVRRALVQNRRTPIGAALGLLTGLRCADLEAMAARADGPRVLRLAAERVRRAFATRSGPGNDDRGDPEVYDLEDG